MGPSWCNFFLFFLFLQNDFVRPPFFNLDEKKNQHSGRYPENTMIAFQDAIAVHGQGIETDIHMTKDGEIVLLHDDSLNRTTNGDGCIRDVNWFGHVEHLRTKREPASPLPRLVDLLHLLTTPEGSKTRVCLDIKVFFFLFLTNKRVLLLFTLNCQDSTNFLFLM